MLSSHSGLQKCRKSSKYGIPQVREPVVVDQSAGGCARHSQLPRPGSSEPDARSRSQVWSGETQPRLIDFFTLLQAITGRLCDLVAELVPIQRVPSLLADYQQRLAARQLAHEEPWTEAILRVLETAAYRASRHQPGMIAATLGIALEVEQRCLQKLELAGVIARGPARFEPAASLTVDTRAIPKLKAHWCEVAAARLSEPLPEDLFSYNVLSASHADIARIRQLLLATYREIRTIVEHTERDEGVALINLQLVHWAPGS